jgi:hypothetical protein
VFLTEIGDIKTIKLLSYGATYYYGARVELDTNIDSYIKITDKSEEQLNTLLELELLNKATEDLYIKFIEPTENYSITLKIKTSVVEVTNLVIPDLVFLS